MIEVKGIWIRTIVAHSDSIAALRSKQHEQLPNPVLSVVISNLYDLVG
jgi:hypothetical protein